MNRGLIALFLAAGPLAALALAAQSAPVSIWPSNPTPASIDLDDNDPAGGIELGVKFRSDVAGQVTGIRYYKGPQVTGSRVGNLWSSTGALLASVTFTGETASGWQQMTFAAPVAVAADTTYVASYFSPDGRYNATNNGLAAAADNAPLHALASSASGGNGLYRYTAAGAFPDQSYQASNYWVDVLFVPTSAGSPGPPAPPPPPAAPHTTDHEDETLGCSCGTIRGPWALPVLLAGGALAAALIPGIRRNSRPARSI